MRTRPLAVASRNQIGGFVQCLRRVALWPRLSAQVDARSMALHNSTMLKLLGSYALAKLLGGGFLLAIVIYFLLTALGR